MTEPLDGVVAQLCDFVHVIKSATYITREHIKELRKAIYNVEVGEALCILDRVESRQESVTALMEQLLAILDDAVAE